MREQRWPSSRANTRTPTKPKALKRVRFSDPGPDSEERHNYHEVAGSASTGLTPLVRRTSLNAAPSPKRRRHSNPIQRRNTYDDEHDELANSFNDEPAGNRRSSGPEVRILSLRQFVDVQGKRQIRRVRLSDVTNTSEQQPRRSSPTQGQQAELQRLRAELAEKDAEIARLRNTPAKEDTSRVAELEHAVEALRGELASRSASTRETADDADLTRLWTAAARDPYSGTAYSDDSDDADEGFGDASMADLACSTPTKRAAALARAPLPSPPSTSPTTPGSSSRQRFTPTTTPPQQSHAGVQAALPDPELASLRLELASLRRALAAHEAQRARLLAKLSSCPGADVEARLDGVLASLATQTAALARTTRSLRRLGCEGADAPAMAAALRAGFRAARLELEYLSPGEEEVAAARGGARGGARVLDLVLSRLRDLARRAEAAERELEGVEAARRHGDDNDSPDTSPELPSQSQLATQQQQQAADQDAAVRRLNQAHGRALAARDARIGQLRREAERAVAALAAAHERIRGLRVDAARSAAAERARAREKVDEVRRELERVVGESPGIGGRAVGMGEGEGEMGARKGVGMAMGMGMGRRKRKQDSGFGLLDEDRDDVDLVG
ncbi:hypothetical protein F4780DRAFT_783854 [Xylariomycetidae sp. FL0641]|nr:hypothetical protein F4780DRAFT_783854 [Xylariomycetidae sp. FL0641]